MAGPAANLRISVLTMSLAYPLAVHLAVVTGHLRAALLILFAVALGRALLPVKGGGPWARAVAAVIATAALAGLARQDLAVLYVPPVLISGLLLYLFGRSLQPEEEPLVTRFARHIDGEPDSRTRRYTRGVTWVWTLFFAAMLVECLLLAWLAPLEVWSLFTNFLNYLFILGLFVLEYAYRLLYFRRRPQPGQLRRMADPGRWREWMGS